jgi:hypothetical protein
MLKLALSHCAVAVVLLGDCFAIPEGRTGKIEFIVTDQFGTRLDRFDVELFHPDAKEPIRVASQPVTVPYGEYQARVSASGFKSVRRNIGVYQTDVPIRVELRSENSAAHVLPPKSEDKSNARDKLATCG